MRRLKNKAVRVLAVIMAAAVTFTNLPVSGWGAVAVMAEEVTNAYEAKSGTHGATYDADAKQVTVFVNKDDSFYSQINHMWYVEYESYEDAAANHVSNGGNFIAGVGASIFTENSEGTQKTFVIDVKDTTKAVLYYINGEAGHARPDYEHIITLEGGNTENDNTGNDNTGNDNTENNVLPADSLIKNGDFSDGLANWGNNQGSSTIAVTDGKLVLNANGLGADWMPGFFQDGIVLKAGSKYRVSFDVVSDMDRSITVGFDAPRMYMQDIELKANEAKTVTYEIGALAENEASSNQKFYFYLGMLHSETNYPEAHTIIFDNVSICEITGNAPEVGGDDTGNNSGDEEETVGGPLVFEKLTTSLYRSQDDGGWAGDSNVVANYDGTTATFTADNFGWELWGVQWKLSGITSKTENNVFAFDVVSTVDKEIGFKNDNNGANPVNTIILKAGEVKHCEFEVAEASLNAVFALYSGGAGSVTFSNMTFGPKTVTDPVDPTPTPNEDEPTTPVEPQYPETIENGTPYTSETTKVKTTVDDENVASKWTLQWSDEFGVEEFTGNKLTGHNTDGPGSALERAAWTYMIGNGSGYSGAGWGNNEKEYYTDENTSVAVGNDIDGGALVITAERENYNGAEFTSTRLWTMDDGNLTKDKEALYTKQYGRVEARIKLEPTEGEDATGLWPAFWMMPAYDVYGTWAASGELDIMEARGSNQHSVDGTIHYGSQWPNNKAIGGSYGNENFSTADWHTYAVEWLPGEIRWYVDDVCYYTTSDWYSTSNDNATDFAYPAPFDQEFYILLNVAVGGNYDGGALSDSLTEASMFVDYVRVYDLQKEDGSVYTKVDYEALESTVSRPTFEAPDAPIAGVVGENMVDVSDLTEYKTTTNYPSEEASVRNAQWFVSNLGSGSGKSTNAIEDGDTLVINTTTVGANDYDVQLIHNVPLTRGYTYEISFDAKADKVKTISGKFANISGYPAYSDGLAVDLETDWNHYTCSFNMVADSDADGRIEFTVGGTTGKTYFKNFAIVCKGKTTEAGADDAKEPLANGNHIYNGTFDQGTNRTYFWGTLENTTLTSEKNVCKGVVTGTSANSGIYQKGINLLQGDSYCFNMDISAANAGDVTVSFVSADEKTVYGTKTFAVSGAQQAVVEFTMPKGVTDTNGMLKIVTGNNTVIIDNVKMIRTTSNNLAWENVDLYPLYNGDFFNGDDGWNIWSENAGWQQHSVNGAGYMDMEYNVNENADFWCVGVQSPAIKMTAGVPYVIKVDYELTKAASIKVETPDGTQTDYDFAQGAHTKTFEFTPTKDVSGSFAMYFGNQPTGGNQHFIMCNISVEVDTTKTTIPAEYQAKKPGSIASAGAVKAGQNIVINTNNAEWANAITEVYVNSKAYDADKYVTVNGTQIIVASELMDKEGSYTVKFAAEGYADVKAIAQKVLEASGNVLVNGKFTTNLDGWETYFSSWNISNGSAEVVDGEAVIHVVSTEGNNWDVQLKQAGLALKAAPYYMLSFDAYATVERPIQMEFANLGTASQTIVNLGTEKQTHYIYFTNVAATEAASVLFMGGNVNGCLGDFAAVGAHDIVIDNVNLYECDMNEILAHVTPAVSLAEKAVLGNDVVFSFEKNDVWAKDVTVTVNGRVAADKYVTVDAANAKITVDSKLFAEARAYTVAFLSEGYTKAEVEVTVLESASGSVFPAAWGTWLDAGEQGTLETTADSLTCHFVQTVVSEWNGPMFWSIQAKKENITTMAGKNYVLSFDADMKYVDEAVTATRGVVIETNAGQQTVQIAPGKNHYELTYTPGAMSNFYVLFMLGGAEADFSTKAHDITLSNIKLVEVGGNTPVEKEPLETPEEVKVEVKEEGIVLTWEAVEGAAAYGIYRAETKDGAYTLIDETTDTTFVISVDELETASYALARVAAAKTYYYAVGALAEDNSPLRGSELVKFEVELKLEEPDEDDQEQPTIPGAPVVPEKPVVPSQPDDTEDSENDAPQIPAITPQAPVTEKQDTKVTVTDGFALPEVTEETVEEKEEVAEESVQEEKTETEDVKTEEIEDEEVPLATPAEETGMSVNVLAVAIVIVLICIGATALGLVFRKKDELE